MKNEWESRDWMDTQPSDRRPQLSPFEMSLVEAVRSGYTVTVHGERAETVEFGAPADASPARALPQAQ